MLCLIVMDKVTFLKYFYIPGETCLKSVAFYCFLKTCIHFKILVKPSTNQNGAFRVKINSNYAIIYLH